MCRVAAFPPGFPRKEALEILANFENKNIDGTGSAYVNDGQFVVEKWAKSFSSIIKTKPFLSHMPCDSWTIAHLRSASHGENVKQNTHPFIVGPWAFIHNGIWSEYNLVRLALSKQVKMVGDTDSEVAAHFWNIIGPKKFSEVVDFAGVFIGLHRNGELWVVKTSGDLEIQALDKERVLLASEFDYQKYGGSIEALHGWYHFDKDGKYLKHKANEDSWNNSCSAYGGNLSSANRSRATDGVLGEDWRSDRYFSNHHLRRD
jgi:hypothetical protein